MLNHVSIGVRDLARTKLFYNAALTPLGYRLIDDDPGSLGYGADAVELWIMPVDRPVAPDMNSGLHFCVTAPTQQSVRDFHAAALRAGGKDNGAPGRRAEYRGDYYAAFVIDPDGYRLEAYCSTGK
jgi:catechol 2,3-dioxygenase-like lactoylglutathione lyase family enzyme